MADNNLLDIVPTRAMLEKGIKQETFKATVFDSKALKATGSGARSAQPKLLNATIPKPVRTDNDEDNDKLDFPRRKRKDDNEFDMKQARHEVIRFGLNGFESNNKKQAEIALAVKLGAKPPKREYKNYKELLANKRHEKERKEGEQKMLQLGKNQVGAASVRCLSKKLQRKKRRDLGDISKHYGVAKPKIFKGKRKGKH